MTHKLIHTPNHLLVVDDSEIKEGDWCLDDCNVEFKVIEKGHAGLLRSTGVTFVEAACKKIIAHLPLNGSPILEGVALLPPLEDDVEKLADDLYPIQIEDDWDKNKQYRDEFIEGYNKAKEKYKYTEEQMKRIYEKGYSAGRNELNSRESDKIKYDYIQSLSQPKMPVGFECEIEYFYMASRMFYKDADWVKCNKNQYESIREEIPTCPLKKVHKEISTPEGHTQWVGKYIY